MCHIILFVAKYIREKDKTDSLEKDAINLWEKNLQNEKIKSENNK